MKPGQPDRRRVDRYEETSSTSHRRPASYLPAEVTSFVGRRHEVAEVRRLLSVSRMVTLTGVGGVGKSRLALRVAGAVQRAFADGVWLVELTDLDDPALLAATVLKALKIYDYSHRPPAEVLIGHLCDKHALVILDNCEHLLAECAVMGETLLRSAPELQILVTSRQPLGIAGERVFAVPTLPLPNCGPWPSGGSLMVSETVQLFIDRAQAVLPSFAMTEANREIIEQICRRLDGIPLGIELAAAQLRALSVQQLLDRLDDRFRLLTSRSAAVAPRHQTLRALIDWSHSLCTEQERLLWERVSVFGRGLDLEAAEAVCSGDGIAREDVIDLVIGLVDKSVLIREEHPAGVRYLLLETIRQYGWERLVASGREEVLSRRHRGWYRNLVHRAEQEWFGPKQVTWFTRLRFEDGNIFTALDSCLSSAETACGLAIAAELWFYWIAAGLLREGRRWLDALLARGPEPTAVRAGALGVNARLAVLQSDFTVAESMLDESRALAGRLGDTEALAQAACVDGLFAFIRRDLRRAVTLFGEALRCYREIRHEVGVVNAVIYLAAAHSLLGHSAEALALFEEGLAMCESREDTYFRSYALALSGIEVWRQGDASRAMEMERRSIRLRQPFDDCLGPAMCAEVLAWIAADNDDFERAARLLGVSQEMWRSVGGPPFDCLAGYHDQCVARARERLGDERHEAAFRDGAGLPFDQALAYVLRERATADEPAAGKSVSLLTRRETEVARLVARGMSNREIAAELVIAQRTAEGHIEHILTKLGFNSRTQIAVWVGEDSRAIAEEHRSAR